jgi:hypothetical protein
MSTSDKNNKEKSVIEPKFSPPALSGPFKLLLIIGITDFIVAFLLTMITRKSHFSILGSGGAWLSIPWWLSFLEGLILISYGFYIIKKNKGAIDVASTSSQKI